MAFRSLSKHWNAEVVVERWAGCNATGGNVTGEPWNTRAFYEAALVHADKNEQDFIQEGLAASPFH